MAVEERETLTPESINRTAKVFQTRTGTLGRREGFGGGVVVGRR
jgi:hypothetical protein